MKKKEVIVFFTGGLDSTYLIYKNLELGHNVQPVYVEILNNENKTLVEKQNINILINRFKEDYGYGRIENIRYSSKIEVFWGNSLQFPQPFLWLMNALMIETRNFDEIQLAYVLSDEAVSFAGDLKKLFNNKLFDDYVSSDRRNKLKFPLLKISKQQIVEELPKRYLKHISSCENPILEKARFRYKNQHGDFFVSYKPCKHCVACKRLINNDYFNSYVLRDKYENKGNPNSKQMTGGTILVDSEPSVGFYDYNKA